MRALRPGSLTTKILAFITENPGFTEKDMTDKFGRKEREFVVGGNFGYHAASISSSIHTLLDRGMVTREKHLNLNTGNQVFGYRVVPSKQSTLNMQQTQQTVAISGVQSPTKVLIVRNGTKRINIDAYSTVLNRFTKPGTRRPYTGIMTSVVSFFLLEGSVEDMANALAAEVEGVDFQITFTPEDAAAAVVAYASEFTAEKIKQQADAYFAQFETPVVVAAPPISLVDVLAKVLSRTRLTEAEQNALNGHIQSFSATGVQDTTSDEDDNDD